MNFFFQAEDGIRDAQESRGLGDVYKRQLADITPELVLAFLDHLEHERHNTVRSRNARLAALRLRTVLCLSLIHI